MIWNSLRFSGINPGLVMQDLRMIVWESVKEIPWKSSRFSGTNPRLVMQDLRMITWESMQRISHKIPINFTQIMQDPLKTLHDRIYSFRRIS